MPPTQLTLLDIERVVDRVITRSIGGAKTARDPRQKLASYPQLMRIDQVAAYLNCDEKHVRNLVEEGSIEAINIAASGSSRRCLRISRDSVAQLQQKKAL